MDPSTYSRKITDLWSLQTAENFRCDDGSMHHILLAYLLTTLSFVVELLLPARKALVMKAPPSTVSSSSS